eukprot:540854_1
MLTTFAANKRSRAKFRYDPIQLTSTSNVSPVSVSDLQIPNTPIVTTPINTDIKMHEHLKKLFDKFDHTKTGTLNLCEFSSACYCIIGTKNLSGIDIIQIF